MTILQLRIFYDDTKACFELTLSSLSEFARLYHRTDKIEGL